MQENELAKLKKEIGILVRFHRKKKKVSQFKMGLEVNMSANQVGRIERGESNPTVETLFLFANYFSINIRDFFTS
ncbi:helix-turn-helix domain-containing protein [Sediminicola luteus]|uniref:HTH cro/C1-type domain-containing protein n=1 Tax=Sediminicola luteus TaxID=319238 RepID=A0A2A4G5K1_9FLAO|nr:helix-turn-helix transcriptional regulator [Sediminicola luteus]PCE63025.1 hypothetical protein B7P33_17275 [Sediminicola luteus]